MKGLAQVLDAHQNCPQATQHAENSSAYGEQVLGRGKRLFRQKPPFQQPRRTQPHRGPLAVIAKVEAARADRTPVLNWRWE
jgi:hypothetical protein